MDTDKRSELEARRAYLKIERNLRATAEYNAELFDLLKSRGINFSIVQPLCIDGDRFVTTGWSWLEQNFSFLKDATSPTIDWSRAAEVVTVATQNISSAAKAFREILPAAEACVQTVHIVWRTEKRADLAMSLQDVVNNIEDILGADPWDVYFFNPQGDWCVEYWWSYGQLSFGRRL